MSLRFHNFRQRLAAHERLLGTMLTVTSPSVAEILAEVGFDWFFVDAEHGPFETPDLLAILQTVSRTTPCIVRVPQLDEGAIKRVLDIGAAGVIVPQVNTPEQAARVVSAARYAPQGSRGVGLARAHGYGFDFADYVRQANDAITVIVQAEHIDAVNNIGAIVETPGIDCVLLGPYDLAASMGKMGEVDAPEVVAAIAQVTEACHQKRIPVGMFAVDAAGLEPYVQQGYTLLIGSVDALLLGDAARRLWQQMSKMREQADSSDFA